MYKLVLYFKETAKAADIELTRLRILSDSIAHLIFVAYGFEVFAQSFTITFNNQEVCNKETYIEYASNLDLQTRNDGKTETDLFNFIPEIKRNNLPKWQQIAN